MSITYDHLTKTFYLDGKGLTYAFYINSCGYAEHLYFGKPIGHDDLRFSRMDGASSSVISVPGLGGKEQPYSMRKLSYHSFPTELSFPGTGDYREPCVSLTCENGCRVCDLLYEGYEIVPDKPPICGMPSMKGGETLILHLTDEKESVSCDLYYTVYEDCGVIARRAVYRNQSKKPIVLDRAYSFSLSLPDNNYEILSLYGNWAKERYLQRTALQRGVFSIDSKRGSSSATLSPFLALVRPGTTEDCGDAYGVNLIYSSSYVLKAEGTNDGRTLVTGGINDFQFSWTLESGDSFETPEVMLAYSDSGLGGMSRAFHDAMRNHLINPAYVRQPRPVVINNWEATYFDFDGEKLKEIAKNSVKIGADTFVLDDGWFGKRNSDGEGLGDWYVNTEKLRHGLKGISDYVHSLGMKFGLWFEPEMVNEDSDLFRAHPDYAIGAPNHVRCCSRKQFVLDITRKDVRDYIVDAVNRVLHETAVEYVKWDCNRNISEFYSQDLDERHQGEFAHRYALGLYDLFDRIVSANPDILFEGCAGGGARFDCGVLSYFPQIWTSDATDAEERTKIQYGTSMVYPLSAMSCHVSAVPNHQTGRTTSFETRCAIAHLGATGYELDTTRLTPQEAEQAGLQTALYHRMEDLILDGDLYRTENPFDGNYFGFQVVSKDRRRSFLTVYRRLGSGNNEVHYLKVKGLDVELNYEVSTLEGTFKGSTLMNIGLPAKFPGGDFVSRIYEFTASNPEK